MSVVARFFIAIGLRPFRFRLNEDGGRYDLLFSDEEAREFWADHTK